MEVVGSIFLGIFFILIGAVLIGAQLACVIYNELEKYKDEEDNNS